MAQLRCSLHGAPDVIRSGLAVLLAPYSERILVLDLDDLSAAADVHLVDLVSGQLDLGSRRELRDVVGSSSPGAVVGLALDSDLSTLRRARALGVTRVVSLTEVGPRLVDVLEEAHRDPAPSPQLAERSSLVGRYDLSAREVDVLTAICGGMNNEQIARHLYLSVNSVKTYIRTAYRKIGVTSRTQALLWGLDHGL